MTPAASAAPISSDDGEASWSLSVKAIGSTLKACTAGDDDGDQTELCEKNFTVTVSPEDALTKLYDQIEGVTGLKASQQRLIYRGRLIDAAPEDAADKSQGQLKVDPDDEPKIKDIVGLGDGHTIHLVKRKERPQSENNNTPSTSNTTATSGALERDESLSGNGTASLLAALIGLGGLDDDTDGPTTANGGRSRLGWRSGRLGRSRNRPHYRLTAEDLQTPDPGSLEPVRQGLMTIHTMLPHAQVTEEADVPSPLEANRRWYSGQWIDVRDTVNQWLEATVVDIVSQDEILPAREDDDGKPNTNNETILEPATDPAVSAGDLEGRRRLLLEPCDEGDTDDEGGELKGFRRRRTNRGIDLLLIHYNGWPHRWDEWLRSDSERIRPFRTRTRHPNGVRSTLNLKFNYRRKFFAHSPRNLICLLFSIL
jgi:Ubiquitin family